METGKKENERLRLEEKGSRRQSSMSENTAEHAKERNEVTFMREIAAEHGKERNEVNL